MALVAGRGLARRLRLGGRAGPAPGNQAEYAILQVSGLRLYLEAHAADSAGPCGFRRRGTQHLHALQMIRGAGLVLLGGISVASCQEDDLFLPFSKTVEADAEGVWSSDIALTESRLTFRHIFGDLEWDAAFSYASFDLEYQPFTEFDFFGFEEDLHEDRFGGQVNVRHALVDRLTLLAGGGVYDGYPDYRRVWIANRYRQKYDHPDFPRIPGYEEPDPKGWNASAGARWEYLPLAGFAELRLGYAADQTAPGYEDVEVRPGEHLPQRGREHLQTKSLNLSSENVLTSSLRSLNEFALIETTDRELRFTYQGSLNVALGPAWVVRAYGGMSTEEPQFDAFFFGTTVEFEPVRNLFFSVTGRYYEDTGEIENSLFTSSAAPPLRSWELGAGLRYVWRRAAVKVYVATFRTDYDPITSGTAEFTYLYSDRKWGLAQIVWSWQF